MRLRFSSLVSVFAVVVFAVVAVMPAAAQRVGISTLETSKTRSNQISPSIIVPNYITDVSGKRVRLVGPRFYPDSARALEFPGRSLQRTASTSEESLSQR